MKTMITRIKRLALALCFVTPLVSWAATMTNPVTGETETYVNTFLGTNSLEWNAAGNWDTGNVPYIQGGVYTSALIDGKTASTASASIDGWALQVGAYNEAAVTWKSLGKIQGDSTMWLTVDSTSSITIDGWGGGNLGQSGKNLNYYVAANNGVTWSVDFASGTDQGLTMNYYLAGDGSVSYKALGKATHVIKQADVTLSGTSQVSSKTLVSFSSSTPTFTAAADIKVYDGSTLKETVGVTSVRSAGTAIADTSSTLTTADAVGTCELVQCTDGIVLYYVDGNPDDIVAKTYKPSISVNFTSGTALSTHADVGVGDYAIPGTSWNNLIGNNGTLSTVTQVDSTGEATTVDGVSVTISGTRGYWTCGDVNASNDLRQGYIDDAAGANASPQVVVSGIPYYSYYAVVYFSNNDANVKFGYVTINGTNYKWDSENSELVECEGADTDSWGASSPTAWTEGGNYIVTPTFVNADGTFTVVGHRLTSARAGIAAIQIVEVPKTAEEGELVIPLSGDTVYPIAEDAEYTTVYVTGVGTLSFSGEGTITTTTLNVGPGATVPMGSSITPTTVTGAGTVVYDGSKPTTGLGWTDSAHWTGTVWVKNITTSSDERKDWNPALYGNAESTLRFTDVNLYFPNTTTTEFSGTVELDAGGLNICDGNAGSKATFAKLTGSGTLSTGGGSSSGNGLMIRDASEFTGTITLTKYKVIIGSSDGTSASGVLQIDSGAVATVASGKTWTAPGGFVVNGTLNADGTLASSHASQAVSGSGTVVFTGSAPSPTGDTWWKNSNWTGTTVIRNYSNWANIDLSVYGNSSSAVRFSNVSGWFKSGSATYDTTLELDDTDGLAFTHNDGYNNNVVTIKALKGSGTYYGNQRNTSDPHVTVVFKDASEFTGLVKLNTRRVVFGDSASSNDYVAGNIYIAEGTQVTVQNTAEAGWWAVGGIQVDGELRANSLARFGGGTNITTSDTGVFTLTSTGNGSENETDTDYARIKGTGSLKYGGTGWRALTTNNLSTAVTLVNEQSGDILLSRALTYTIGSLSGSKKFQGNYGSGSRYLNIVQTKDTEWSGTITTDGSSRLAGFSLDVTSTGTLTLSGTETQSATLAVNGGAVNLTGTWKGATTVAGTIGGTGTLTGDLTFSDGATFKAFAADDADGLVVSGTVGYPAEGTVTVDVSAIEPETDVALLKAEGLNRDNFALADGTPEGYSLEVVDGVLTLTVPTPSVSITIPEVENATVAVTVDGVAVTPENGVVTAQVGATVVVTYTAAEGYTIANGTIEFTAAADTTTVDTTDVTVTEYIAWIYDENGDQVGDPYTTVLEAVQAFLANNIGNSIRFKTSIESSEEGSFHQMLISVCRYDSETLTYTRLPVVANVTSGQFTVGYTSLASAVANVLDGSVVTLVANVTLDERVDVNPGENTTLTIDLGGYTITREGTSGNGSAFRVVSGTVTIKNGTIDCTQDDADIVANGVCAIDAGGKNVSGAAIVLEDLTVKVVSKNGSCVYPWVGNTITIKSGTYRNDTKEVYGYGRFKDAGLKGMAVNQGNTADQLLFIEGGTFSQVNPALGDDSWADGAGTFVADGYEATETSTGVWTVDVVTDPTIGGETVEPAKVFDTATTAEGIVYPKAPTVSGEPGSQTITYKDTVVEVPAYYTATLSGTTVMLALNSNALPTIGATEASGDDEAVPATEVTDETFGLGLTTTSTKLYYGLATCDTPSGTFVEPTTLTQGTGKAMSLKANRGTNENVKFYKVFVTDIAPVAP